jgi:hypothetical protein
MRENLRLWDDNTCTEPGHCRDLRYDLKDWPESLKQKMESRSITILYFFQIKLFLLKGK